MFNIKRGMSGFRYVENFRNAPPKSRAERVKEGVNKHSFRPKPVDVSESFAPKDCDDSDREYGFVGNSFSLFTLVQTIM